ncbi:MAG: hypothetical protein V1918_01470, partial [Planctomycetota bacterium]
MIENGEMVTLTARKEAVLEDVRGLRLLSRNFSLLQRQGLVRADGPGILYISAAAAQRSGFQSLTGRTRPSTAPGRKPGENPGDYTVHFDGELVYNLLTRTIVFHRNVELEQETLYGRCDRMDVLLEADPGRRSEDPNTQGLTIASAECRDNVFFRRYEPPAPNENLKAVLLSGASTERPGT